MELDNSATSFIIIILTIVTVAYVVYTNYNDILDIKSKLNKLLSSPDLEENCEDEEEFQAENYEEESLFSNEWEKNIPLFLPSSPIQEPQVFSRPLPIIFEEPEVVPEVPKIVEVAPEVVEVVPEVLEVAPEVVEVAPEVVKPAIKISVRKRKSKQ